MRQIRRYCVQHGTTDYSLRTGALRQIMYSQTILGETIEAFPQLSCLSLRSKEVGLGLTPTTSTGWSLRLKFFSWCCSQTKHWYRCFLLAYQLTLYIPIAIDNEL